MLEIPRRLRRSAYLLFLILLIAAAGSPGQAQSIADGFDPGANGLVQALAVQPDGRILVGGQFTQLGGGGTGATMRNFIGRLNADGSLDNSFDPGANNRVYAIVVQPDGKILVSGLFTTLGGGGTGTPTRNFLGRLNADGSLDTNFNPGANGEVYSLALQPDGKILVGGNFSTLGGGGSGTFARNKIGRLNSDGSIDPNFNPGANGLVYALAVQPDGRILVGGLFTMLGGGGIGTIAHNRIGRLNADGSVDGNFNPGANNGVLALAVQPSGRILVSGLFNALGGVTGTATHNFIGRLNADGSLDDTFDPGANGAVVALEAQADGRILVIGDFTLLGGGKTGNTTRNFIGRLNADGSLDLNFDPGANGQILALALQPDGRILVGGSSFNMLGGGGTGNATRNHIGRLTNNGSAIQNLSASNAGSTLTWTRGGTGPEVDRVTFESSANGINFSSLGTGTRISGGWQLTGLSLPANQTIFLRARGFYATGNQNGSASIVESVQQTSLPGTIQFSAASYTVGEGDQRVNIVVTRSGNISTSSTVDYATSDTAGANKCNVVSGAASSRCDYLATIGTLSFAATESSKTISIPIIDDAYAESSESFAITLSNPSGASLGSPASATVTISDNDTVNGTNPIDQANFFVRQHYLDFLNREPDASGLSFWTNEITSCGTNQPCIDVKRVNVSAAFFLSIEFQQTGYLVERTYKASYGDATGASTSPATHQLPVPIIRLNEFLADTQQIGEGLVVGQTGWETVLENNKQAFTAEFVQRPRFTTAFPTTMTPAQFVDALFANTVVTPSSQERQDTIALFGSASTSANAAARAAALRRVAENSTFTQQEFNRAFVLMQYFGYLRRNPNDAPEQTLDYTGYDFWLTKLNQFNGNFQNAEMVKAFLASVEYRGRFGP